MSLAGLVFFCYGHVLASFFTGGANPAASADAARLLKVAAFAMPSLAIAMIVNGALRGAGDTRWPLAINLSGMLGIRIPLAYAVVDPWQGMCEMGSLVGRDASLFGAWFAIAFDVSLRSLLVLVRFFQGGWKQTEV